MDPILKCKPKIPVRRQGQSLVPWIYVSDRGLVFRIHKDISKLSNKKNKCSFLNGQNHLGRHFTKQDIWMTNTCTERRKLKPQSYNWGCRGNGTLIYCSLEHKMAQPLWKIVRKFLKKLNICPPYDRTIPLLRSYPREEETLVHTVTGTQIFIAPLFVIAKDWKQLKCPPSEWINWLYIYIQWNSSQQQKGTHKWYRQQHGYISK